MLASTPNLFLNRALNACMFLSGLYAEKWLSWTKPSIGSAIDGRSCCSRKQSIPASLYFLVITNEWSWVISRSESVPANARRSEEHTSELQSLAYLVCRLLLEKKKK